MAVNDRIWTSLSQHGGGTINERVYNYLGSLGFTGTISDRLAKYTHNNKQGWQALIEGFGLSGSAGVLRQELFGEGQQGVMYVPQPTYLGQQLLYQDSAGTTPVEADGQPAGLMLDRSRGLVPGPELITNGKNWTGASGNTPPDGWVYDGSLGQFTVVDGALEYDRNGDGGGANLGQTINTESGKSYVVNFDVISTTNDDVFIIVTSGDSAPTALLSGVGSKRFQFVADGTNSLVEFRPASSSTQVIVIDNFSIRELPGNHATAPSDAARPLYRTDGVLHWLQFDGVDDILQFTATTVREAWLSVSGLSTGGVLSEGSPGYIRSGSGGWEHNDGGSNVFSGIATKSPQSINVRYPTITSSEWLDSTGDVGSVATAREFESPEYLMGFEPGVALTEGDLYGVIMIDYISVSAKRVQALNYMAGLSGAPTL